jgi:uncharacterized protein (TIGR00375 family)
MRLAADLHIHSRFSRATSSDLSLYNLVKYAHLKGLSLLGTGDFTHPSWLSELKDGLEDDGTGFFKYDGFNFVLSGEISSIYMQGKKLHRIHNILLCPDFETAAQINDMLKHKNVNLGADGRPICGIPSHELVESLKGINPMIEVIPAHAWTPWFSLFGSKSGFDSMEECFMDQAKNVHAIETGLSSDPAMNWRLSQLDKFAMVSFSDAHSFWPWRIGREATIFEVEKETYENLIRALRTKEGLVETIEVDPSYGKYHYDGHRDCNVSMSPGEAKRIANICPVCRRPLTIGVLHRIEELADRPEGFVPKDAKPFRSVIPLSEIIAFALGTNISSTKVWEEFNKLVDVFGSEFNVLLEADGEQLKKITKEKIAVLLLKMRSGKINVKPGYDGVYGEIAKDGELKRQPPKPQKTLGDF